MNSLLLLIFMILHWIVVIINCFYLFIRTDTTYDWLYFSVICITISSWTLSGGECYLSYLEKKSIDREYVFHSSEDLPFVKLVFGETLHGILPPLFGLLQMYTAYVMLTLYKVPLPIKITFLYFMIYLVSREYCKKNIKSELLVF